MKPWNHGRAALALAACLLPATQVQAAGGRTLGELEFTPCVLRSAGLPRPTEAQCTTLAVPQNPAEPGGRHIELALAWIPVDGPAEPDPVLLLAGGPGQSAREAYPAVAAAFADIVRSRHLLLLDQRGTGGSNPLHCPDEELDESLFGAEPLTPGRIAELAARCRDALAERADLRFYTTTEAVHDLEQLRRAVGAERLNLVGVSYGTRVGQQYAATHPERVRTLLLDGLVPNSLVLGQEHARNLQEVLEVHFRRCREVPACMAALGDPAARLEAVAARLQGGGREAVRYRDPTSGEWREEVPSYDHLAGVLRMYAYSPVTAAALPLIVAQADRGDYAGLLAMARMMSRDLGSQMATGMHNSVICSEDADELVAAPGDEDTLLGARLVEFMQAQCGAWPRGARPEGFRSPLRGEFPVLLVSGEFDPVTPPRYGDEVASHLSHARHLVLPGQGHSLLGTGCMPKLAAQFIERADALELDASCIHRLAAPPPFSGLHGWEP